MSVSIDIRKKLSNFTLEVALEVGNETLGFLGASGCGKSQTLRCIAGVETPDEGKIVVNGVTYFDSAAKINLTPQQRKTALLFQNFQLFPHLSVAKNIEAGIDQKLSKEERIRIVKEEIYRFSLEGYENRFPLHLSGGQQQRVALARMLAASPSILMLDEPFSALDAHLKARLEQDLLDLFDNFDGSILYVSHDIDEAYRLCDRLAVVEQGKLESVTTPEETISHPASVAALKLSGCKNITKAKKAGDHKIYLPKWGIYLDTAEEVPDDVSHMGVRASYIRTAVPEDTSNVNRAFVVRVTDSRFEHAITLQFVDAPKEAELEEDPRISRFLSWKQSKLAIEKDKLAKKDEILDIYIPPESIYLVTR